MVNFLNPQPAPLQLPPAENATKALHAITQQQDTEAWRSLVLEAIEYATTGSSSSGGDNITPYMVTLDEAIITQKVNETVNFFRNALDLISKTDAGSDILDMAQGIIVDALWLMGTMLRPADEEGKGLDNSANADKKENSSSNSSSSSRFSALCRLTRALMAKPEDPKFIAIPPFKFMTSLEPQFLRDSGILSKQYFELFIKKNRILNTDTHYRQKKVNLMQEESEGYAKFVRILTNLPCVYHHGYENIGESNHDIASIEKEPWSKLSHTLVLSTVELIGTFDLDPNRCLDLIINVLESEIKKVITNDSRQVNDPYQMLRNAKGHSVTVHLLLKLILLFPKGNICHLLGFKFASYRSKGVNFHEQVDTPQSLYLTTALLASHGLLSLSDLQPHLPPTTEIESAYNVWREEYVKKIKKMGIVSLNSSKESTPTEKEGKNGHDVVNQSMDKNQFIQLFCVMLDIGFDFNVASALFQSQGYHSDMKVEDLIMKCCCLYPPLGAKICDILEKAIGPLMDAKVQNIGSSLCLAEEDEDGEIVMTTHGGEGCSLLPSDWYHKRPLELSSKVSLQELCSKIDCLVDPIVMSGGMGSKPVLYCKLCRLVRAMLLAENRSLEAEITNVHDSVLEFIERVLVAPLSLFPYNPAITSELWSVLSTLSYNIRYALYAAWRKHGLEKAALRSNVQPFKPLAQIESEVTTGISTKYLLKRMSKDNIKDMGKQVSKVAHNNPLVVFTLMLNQIESYDNLILIMVDTFKFMSVLSLDVMGYCLLVNLGGEGEKRNKLKDDGVNAAQWLSSLETFTGAFYKRFQDVELRGLLAYLTRRLHEGYTLELGVLLSLVKMAGGYGFMDSESTASLSDAQLEGRCGSLTLRRETSDFGIVEKIHIHSSRQLRKSLQDGGRGVVFLILLSQLRAKALYHESRDSPKQIKLIGNLYDKCHRTMNVLLAFLTDGSQDVTVDASHKNTGAIAQYSEVVPSLGELLNKYALANHDAWALCRPLIRASLFLEEDNIGRESDERLKSFNPKSWNFDDILYPSFSKETWDHITPLLFVRFFSHSIYDLTCPTDTYENELLRLKREIDRLELLQKGGRDAIGIQASMASAVAAAGGTQRDIREATAFTKEHAIELERLKTTTHILGIDMERQRKHSNYVINGLKSEKSELFSNINSNSSETASRFFSTCIFPRCLNSPEDAIYCARFIKLLHDIDTTGFEIIPLFSVIVNAVVGALYSITEDEAGCFGVFMNEIWRIISLWRYNEEAYNSHISFKPSPNDSEEMSHSNYVQKFNLWHTDLGTVFIGCLRSSEYMHTRTALIILSKIVDYFPSKSTLGDKLLAALSPLQADTNLMQDIKAMAQGYSSKLIKARDTGKWKEEDIRATQAREHKERNMQQSRIKHAEKQLEEMAKDIEESKKRIGDNNNSRPDTSIPSTERRHRPTPIFTPPAMVTAGASGEHGPTRVTSDRGSARQSIPPRTRDSRLTNQGPRPSPLPEPGTGPSVERWERSGPDGGRGKRGRSPSVSNRGRDSDRGHDKDDGKRLRRDLTPPRRGGSRLARR